VSEVQIYTSFIFLKKKSAVVDFFSIETEIRKYDDLYLTIVVRVFYFGLLATKVTTVCSTYLYLLAICLLQSPFQPTDFPFRLYYTILYYTIGYYTILYYTILYYTILYYTILYYIYYTILYYTILYILYYTILYYTILYYSLSHSFHTRHLI
jgi:hypothetical protein